MPHYSKQDILDNPNNTQGFLGFVGKIARINLSTGEVSVIDTYQFVPKYVGGRMIINRIAWDELPPGTGPFDEGNKFIYMTGPTTGTGIPAGGRSEACAIGASNNPEQYSWGNIGGWFATELKYAGWDGFIVEGKAQSPVIIKIKNEKIEILPAGDLWGTRVHQAQEAIAQKYGEEYKSMVIGPAGENLVRIASITHANDCCFSKGGFGAVWGSKKLKAITVCGTGVVAPADLDKLIYLRTHMNQPGMRPSPVLHKTVCGIPGSEFPAVYDRGNVACSPGCNQHCNALLINGVSAFGPERQNHIEKCVSMGTFDYRTDIGSSVGQFWPTKQNYCAPCKMLGQEFPVPDFSDPHFEEQAQGFPGDTYDLWQPDYDRGTIINDLCNEYGIDKWEVVIWMCTWLSMCQKEGLFEGMDNLGCSRPVDASDAEFMKEFIGNLVYRRGYYGNIFAEGMSRAIRTLGYEKFSESIFHNRHSRILGGKRTDIPVSWEAANGQSVHWQGRGFQGAIEKPTWLAMNINNMMNTRDAQTVEHFHAGFEHHAPALADPYHYQGVIDAIIHIQNYADIKDSVMSCEWQSPDPRWPEMESVMYQAATGYPMTPEELMEAAFRSKLLFRAFLIRNHGRTRQSEIASIWRTISIPDSWNEVADWKSWNEMVDLVYEARGFDLETGWPYRETYEKYGLEDVADEMERLGLLPTRPAERWSDYGEPPFVLFSELRKLEPDYEG
ncbi:MAG: hypothetical protein IJJ14_03705 [Coriobacteriales bacterium]|nr:hypothetical protein [Coriobacteriales bacterium]MBQ6586420.1 hypothetical protein [Coriobacteriales bacterium]